MLTDFQIFELIQDKNIINKAQNTILQSEMTGKHFIEQVQYKDTTLRFRARNTGMFNIDYLDTFVFQIPKLSYKKSIQFFKPLGFYWFRDVMKLAFWIMNKHRIVSLEQDNHSGFKKNIDIYKFSDDKFNDGVMAAFSAENELIVNSLAELVEQGKDDAITEPDSLFMTKEFTIYPTIDLTTFRYINIPGGSHIQVYFKDKDEFNMPIAGTSQDKHLKINPMIKKYYDKYIEFDILSSKTQ
jgi:hypothetical protein